MLTSFASIPPSDVRQMTDTVVMQRPTISLYEYLSDSPTMRYARATKQAHEQTCGYDAIDLLAISLAIHPIASVFSCQPRQKCANQLLAPDDHRSSFSDGLLTFAA